MVAARGWGGRGKWGVTHHWASRSNQARGINSRDLYDTEPGVSNTVSYTEICVKRVDLVLCVLTTIKLY